MAGAATAKRAMAVPTTVQAFGISRLRARAAPLRRRKEKVIEEPMKRGRRGRCWNHVERKFESGVAGAIRSREKGA